jgi:hypothetical protein
VADIKVFITVMEAELEAMNREQIGVNCRGPQAGSPAAAAADWVILTLTCHGLQWRVLVKRSPCRTL